MSYCKICGDEEKLSKAIRFWSPDDGWRVGRFCPWCLEYAKSHGPKPEDFAWDKRGELISDEDEMIDEMFG